MAAEAALSALEHAASRARLLREALADAPPERVERRLAEVRAGNDPGKARLVAALAQQLAVARRMRAALAAYDADVERIVVELETARGRVLADSDPGSGLAALQDELETLAARSRRCQLVGNPPPWVASGAAGAARPSVP